MDGGECKKSKQRKFCKIVELENVQILSSEAAMADEGEDMLEEVLRWLEEESDAPIPRLIAIPSDEGGGKPSGVDDADEISDLEAIWRDLDEIGDYQAGFSPAADQSALSPVIGDGGESCGPLLYSAAKVMVGVDVYSLISGRGVDQIVGEWPWAVARSTACCTLRPRSIL